MGARNAAEQYAKSEGANDADRAKNLDSVNWVAEGRDLAAKVAYQSIQLDDKGELLQEAERTNVTPDRDYLRRARDTARVQVVVGGERLGAILKQR